MHVSFGNGAKYFINHKGYYYQIVLYFVFFFFSGISCPCGYRSYGGNCYTIPQHKKYWRNARLECQNKGGDLASILSEEEHKYVWDTLRHAVEKDM